MPLLCWWVLNHWTPQGREHNFKPVTSWTPTPNLGDLRPAHDGQLAGASLGAPNACNCRVWEPACCRSRSGTAGVWQPRGSVSRRGASGVPFVRCDNPLKRYCTPVLLCSLLSTQEGAATSPRFSWVHAATRMRAANTQQPCQDLFAIDATQEHLHSATTP